MNDKPIASQTDEELIAAFQQENAAAFDEIVRRYRDPLYNFVVRLLGDTLFSEDVVQETFVRVYRNKHRYHQVAKFSTWIYTIASNLAKTELRRRKVRNFFSISSKGNEERDYDIQDQGVDVERREPLGDDAQHDVGGGEVLVLQAVRLLVGQGHRVSRPIRKPLVHGSQLLSS